MFNSAKVRVRGPLAPHIDGFWSELLRRGYPPSTARVLLHLAAHVSRWLEDRGLDVHDLTSERVTQFARHRRRQGYVHYRAPRSVEPLLGYLRGLGAAPPPTRRPDTPVDRFVRAYTEFLAVERGLGASTIRGSTDFARHFIEAEFGADGFNGAVWRTLNAARVIGFVSRRFRRSSPAKCQRTVTHLRSLLRYLHVQGQLARDLAGCVPAVAGWRLASLPKGLEPAQVEQLLATCDPRSLAGVRDRAVLCLLVRLGLRAGEVAALQLADVDWRAGEIVIRGKPRRETRLPLPADVGKAIVTYLRRRPQTHIRAVFLCARAPHRPITAPVITGLTGRALRAIGVSAGSAHVLRHTAATQMLRHGASLAEIGHVLRHRHVDTTAIYAKVDHAALRMLVQPWPGGAV